MPSNKLQFTFWIIALLFLMALSSKFQSSTKTFLGVIESRETNLSSKFPAIIKEIHAQEGDEVAKGEPLLVLASPELVLNHKNLQLELQRLKAERNVRRGIISNETDSNYAPNSLGIQISQIQHKFDAAKKELNNLTLKAPFNGVIGSVHFKNGERVSPFTTIITFYRREVSLVKGVLHETVAESVKIGDRYIVEGVNGRERKIFAKVVSVGSRIVPFPDRLQNARILKKNWGREVYLEVEENTSFLLGELVTLTELEGYKDSTENTMAH